MKLKSKDIAKALGVSTATVSLAINDKPGVNPETKREILEYIETFENKKRSVSGTTNKFITMIVLIRDPKNTLKDVGNFLFNLSYQECCRVMNYNGYDVTMIYFDPHEQEIGSILKECERKGSCGVFVWGFAMHSELMKPLRECNLPMLIYDNNFYCKPADNVLIDNAGAVRMCLEYLYSMGHEEILYVSNKDEFVNFKERESCCRWFNVPRGKNSPKIIKVGSDLGRRASFDAYL